MLTNGNSGVSSKALVMAILLILGGVVCGVLGALHAIYTLQDLRKPRRLVPADPSVAQAMANSALRLSRGGTDMWRAWIGFNFSHSLGVLLTAALAVWTGFEINTLPIGIFMPVLVSIGCVYLLIALRYWFRGPVIGVGVATACFAAAWVLSLT